MKVQDSSNRSLILLCVLLAICLIAVNLWTIQRMLVSQSRFEEASSELSLSQLRVTDIQRLKYRPTVASLEKESDSEMTRRVDEALAKAGISNDQLTENNSIGVSELPQESLRNGKANYEQRLTNIKLVAVTMQQLVQFCEFIEDPKKGLTVRDLAFVADTSNASTAAELWTVTLTLTQLIFSPTS